jgi:hypothetical protein
MAMVTRGTVKTHVARILMKLDLTTDVTGSLLTSLVTRAGKPMQRVAPHNAIRRRQYSRRICTVIGGSGLHPPENRGVAGSIPALATSRGCAASRGRTREVRPCEALS